VLLFGVGEVAAACVRGEGGIVGGGAVEAG